MSSSCAVCGQNFTISAEETGLRRNLETVLKVGALPEPIHCPDCLIQRKMLWRNERSLYKRKSDMSDKEIISIYPQTAPFPVYERSEWWSDNWDALSYAQEFDFSKSFNEQFTALQKKVPRAALNGENNENSDYCNSVISCKDCYLCFSCYYNESLLYCYFTLHSKNSVDCNSCNNIEQCYECIDCNNSYSCSWCQLSHNCNDCAYLYDCRGCTSCFGCVGLRQKSYCFFNEQLSKDEYMKRVQEIDTSDYSKQSEIKQPLQKLILAHPHLYSAQDKTENCTGDNLFQCKNCHQAFQAYTSQDCLYLQDAEDITNSLDAYHVGWSTALYDCYSSSHLQTSAFFAQCWNGNDLFYCDSCFSCSSCFGCVGLKSKKHCILNRQYTKEEYEALLPKIVEHMRKSNEWGHFFDASLSPYAYDESLAQEYFPLTKEEATKQGFRWADYESPSPTAQKIIPASALPAKLSDVPDDILNWAIECAITKKPFRITKQELTFYREHKLPIPRRHPAQRHTDKMAQRNPRKLFNRHCDNCKKEIWTPYAPDRPEIIYCETCYLQAVY